MLLGAFRAALRIAAPAVALKAEAIVSPRELVPYLRVRPRLPQRLDGAAVERSGVRPGRADDRDAEGDAAGPSGRGLADLRALPRRHRLGDHARGRARVGEDDHLHRRFLADFYAGEFPGTFARGARFQPDPRTGEARTSGSCASLAGLESAGDDPVAVELAVRRVLLLTPSRSPTAGCR